MTRLGSRQGLPLWAKILMPLLMLLILAGGVAAWFLTGQTGPAGGGEYTLEVQPGDTLAAVAQELEDNEVVRSADALRYEMRRAGTDGSLKEGLYDVSGQMTVAEVAEALAGTPRIPTVKVAVPEGLRIKDLPPIFEKSGFDPAAIEAALNDPSLSEYAELNLEGFVFPATYEFKEGASAEEVVGQMVSRMNQEFTPERVAQAESLGLNVYDWATLASMVQAEAANNEEMPIIAGVFLNRLRDGMTLGSDPTVAYGLGKDLPELDRSAGDFDVDHDWSTYTRQGLPKTPINNPGAPALEAVLNAQRQLADGRDAMYFLHGKDQKIYVNATYDEHLADRERYM
ncbi:endolytic transglycosylase MltG [Deinococcus radiophilus]|uniref:Endolytic murein transglycosylase n=1 Tax=Deinococcus radiophilus TaxID=32062 RepID=A0A431W4C0_9DEIO|nr:endolytic transglycosylase MltG [Deinococcus radiophilus]RTR30326.1 endolytic transglycosylase MltG [Deinococcus radiophilus]UFA49875.1 endolytic transglycosylase MltG [Deinococcus radiophilus]